MDPIRHEGPSRSPGSDTDVSAHIEPGVADDAATLVFEGPAIPDTLATFTGVLTLHGLDIASATIVRTGERVRDTFRLHVHPGGMPGEAEIAQLAAQASSAIAGVYDLAAEMDRRRVVPCSPDDAAHVQAIGPDAEVTRFIVSATDRPGLLYDLAAALSRHGMRTRSISVVTSGRTAIDTFEVVGHDSMPLADPAEISRVRDALLAAAQGYVPPENE